MRWIFRLFFILVVLALVAGAFLVWFPANTVARLAAERFSAQTGRQLIIGGDVSATLWPVIGVTAHDVTLANPDWATDEALLTTGQIYIGINPMTLFSDVVEIRSVELVDPVISLEQGADGSVNWTFGDGDGESSGPGFDLSRLTVTNGTLTYRNGTAPVVEVSAASGTLDLGSDGAALLEFAAGWRGQSVGGTLSSPDFAALVNGDGTVDADLALGASSLKFQGALRLSDVVAKGPLRLEILDRTAVFGLFGLAPPDLPQGLGANRIGVIGTLDLAGSRAEISGLQLNLDQNHLTGAVRVDFAGRPRIDADLRAAKIDMPSGRSGPAGSGGGWSEDTLPLAALQGFDGTLNLSFAQATFGSLRLGQTQINAVLNSGSLVADIPTLGVFNGTVSGRAEADVGERLRVRADLTAQNLETQRIGLDLVGSDRLMSRASGKIVLSGSGRSMSGLVGSLDGQGDLALGPGQLNWIDVAAALRNLDPSFDQGSSRTVFDSATASFSIADGVLDNPDLVLNAPILIGNGQGRIGLGTRDLDYTFVAKLPESVIGKAIELPVRIYGSWSAPQFSFDFNTLIAARFGVDLEGMGETALEDLRGRISDELGIEIKPGQDMREALSQGLEQKALDALTKGLLGGDGPRTPLPDVALPEVRKDAEAVKVEITPVVPTEAVAEPIPAAEPEPVVKERRADVGAPLTSPLPRARPWGNAPDAAEPVVEPEPVAEPEPAAELPAEPEPEAAPEVPPEATAEPAAAPEPEPAPEPPAEPEAEVAPEAAAEPAAPTEPAACPDPPTPDTILPCVLPDGTLKAE